MQARHTGVARCYTRGSLPPERQYSDWPDPSETNVSWWVPPHELGQRAEAGGCADCARGHSYGS